jgi:hypothetical protein
MATFVTKMVGHMTTICSYFLLAYFIFYHQRVHVFQSPLHAVLASPLGHGLTILGKYFLVFITPSRAERATV